MNQTEAWLYNKAKEADNEIELQDLYTIKFMFGGSWVMDLLEEYHKHQLTLTDVSQRSELLDFMEVLEKLPRVNIPYDMKMLAIRTYLKSNCG